MLNRNFLFTQLDAEEDDFLIEISEDEDSESMICAADEFLDEMEAMDSQRRLAQKVVYWH